MGLEMGEPSRGATSVMEDVSLDWSNEFIVIEPYLEEAPFEELCGDDLIVSAAPSIGHINSICTKPLDLTLISSPLLSTTSSYFHAFHESLGGIRAYYPSIHPYCARLENMLGKIMWATFFDHAFDFSMAFN